MAFTVVTQSNVANTVLPALAAKALQQLTSHRYLATLIGRAVDLSPETPRQKGDVIRVMTPSTFSANDKAENAEVTVQAGTIGTSNLTIDKWKEVSIRIGDKAKLFSSADMISQFGTNAGMALIRQVNSDLLGEYASAGGTAVGTYGAALTAAVMRTLWQQMSDAELPSEDRFVVIPPVAYADLLAIAEFTKTNEYGSQAPQQQGELGDLYGMKCHWNPGVPTTTVSSATRYHGIAFQRNCIVWAPVTAELPDPRNGVIAATATLADSDGRPNGFSVRTMLGYDQKEMCHVLTFDLLYGVLTARAAGVFEVRR